MSLPNLPSNYFEELDWSVLMQRIGLTAVDRLNSYSNSHSQVTSLPSIAIEEKLTKEQEDTVLDSYGDMISPDYRPWFAVQLKRIGRQRFIDAGERARKYGKNPSKLFASLVRP